MKYKMKYMAFLCLSVLISAFQLASATGNVQIEVPRIREGQEVQETSISPNWQDAMEPCAVYEVDVSEWFEGAGTLTYHYLRTEKIGTIQLDEDTGIFKYRPWCNDIGRKAYIEVYAQNEAGKSEHVLLSIYIDKAQNAPDTEYTVVKDTYKEKQPDELILNPYDAYAFAAKMQMHGNKILQVYLDGQGVAYKLEEEQRYPTTGFKIFGIAPKDASGLSFGKHMVKIIMSGGADIEFPVYVQEVKKQYMVTYTAFLPGYDTFAGLMCMGQVSCSEGEPVILPTPVNLEHYAFAGWWSAEDKQYTSETPIYSDVALKGRWEPKVYTVTFMDGNAVYAADDIAYGNASELPEDPQKAGYRFQGWYTAENGNGTRLEEGAAVEGSMTLYANWGKISRGSLRPPAPVENAPQEKQETHTGQITGMEFAAAYKNWWEQMRYPFRVIMNILPLF